MFPTAITVNPGSYAGSTSVVYRKEPFLRKRQRHGWHPDKSDLASRALACKGKKVTSSFFFLKGKAFHLFVDYLPVNRIFQVDYIHD